MYNTHEEISKFYDKYVRLSREQQKTLTGYRDRNINRLEKGLQELGYQSPTRTCGQGSYSMATMVQHPDNDYDIDTAVIFLSEDLPTSSLKARQRVLAGIEAGGGDFKQPPEARTNAVTVWYQEGHHIDLAVYRTYIDPWGKEIIEHAGAVWTRRDPLEITNWFKEQVSLKSPSNTQGAGVDDCQMRRIVQFLKMFAKSRSSWNLPGGLLISVLVSECYVPDSWRDDISLYYTMSAIRTRLQGNMTILNPLDPSLELTYKQEYVNQVCCFGEKLGSALEWLKPLSDMSCDDLSAYKAWNKVFQHNYWQELIAGIELSKAEEKLYVSSSGLLHTEKPQTRSIQSPPHRFYGD